MVEECSREGCTQLQCDVAGAHPWYVYASPDRKKVLYSKSIVGLLSDERVGKPLEVSEEGVSFLLQSGVVPPPRTIYRNIFVVGIGVSVVVRPVADRFELEFSYVFPFNNASRKSPDAEAPDEALILELLAKAVVDQVDSSRPSFLFHSAGKDSNMIALALAEAGWQSRVTLITQKSLGPADESLISRDIAARLGFRHFIMEPSSSIESWPNDEISNYFSLAPFPCTDDVSMAYPLYAVQIPELKGANIIDGMGNDVYIGHVPTAAEFNKQKYSKYLAALNLVSRKMRSEGILYRVSKYRAEHVGIGGLSDKDASEIYPGFTAVRGYWHSIDDGRDYLDLRSMVRGGIIDQEIFIRKVRNFCDAYGSRLVLPWASQSVAEYFARLPEEWVFDRRRLKNKIVLREILKNRISLDSDKVGKRGFSFDKDDVIDRRWPWVYQQIAACELWNGRGVINLSRRLKRVADINGRPSLVARSLLNRLLLISLWHTNSRYVR